MKLTKYSIFMHTYMLRKSACISWRSTLSSGGMILTRIQWSLYKDATESLRILPSCTADTSAAPSRMLSRMYFSHKRVPLQVCYATLALIWGHARCDKAKHWYTMKTTPLFCVDSPEESNGAENVFFCFHTVFCREVFLCKCLLDTDAVRSWSQIRRGRHHSKKITFWVFSLQRLAWSTLSSFFFFRRDLQVLT